MKWLKAIFTAIGVLFAGLWGGQKNKAVRRFGIPSFGALNWKRGWPLLFLIPTLCLGYGQNGWLMEHIENEFLVRLVYAALLSLPFFFYGLRRGLFAVLALVLAFQVHAGSLGYVAWFGDILIEDFCRYLTLGVLMAFNLFFYDKN